MRGIHLENPACDCPSLHLSRLQVAGEKDNQVTPRALHFTCAVGGCGYFDYMLGDNGEIVTLRRGTLQKQTMVAAGL